MYLRKAYYAQIILAVIFFWVQAMPLRGQTKTSSIDSFREILNAQKSDTDKVKLMLSRAAGVNCADSLFFFDLTNEALALAEKVKWNEGICNADFAIGGRYLKCLRKYRTAAKYYEAALNVAQASGSKNNQVYALTQLGLSYQMTAQYIAALARYQQILALGPDLEYKMSTLGNMGQIYSKIGDFAHSLIYYDSSLKTLEAFIREKKASDVNDSVQRAALLISMSEIYVSMSLYDKALEIYGRVLKMDLSNRQLQKTIQVWALTGIANTYKTKKDYANATVFFKKALEESSENYLQNEEATILYNLGSIYLQQGDVEHASEFGERALAIVENNNIQDMLPVVYATLGKVYTAEKKFDKAAQYLQKSIEIAKKYKSVVDEKDAWEALSKTYEHMQQPGLALNAYKNFISIRDSVFNIDKANELSRIDLQFEYTKQKQELAKENELKMQRQKMLTYSGFFGLAGVLLLSFFIYRNYNEQKKANTVINKEKQVSENLLLNILPEEVAQELKENGVSKARHFEHVTVLFTDFVNFTHASEKMEPEALIDELHECFKTFDGIMERHNIEKIKTIGDAYLAVCGLPTPDDNHATNMVKAAIDICTFMNERYARVGDKTFKVRLGIHSGSVVAGIVGVKKFAYDIWGDTVNTAARMEEKSETGKINISQTTYELVKDKFKCEYRGEIDAKNKGMMKMYYVGL